MFDIDAVSEPEVWGPYFWDVIYILALVYHPFEKEKYQRFFDALGDVLPCGSCGDNYKNYTSSHPIDLSSSEAMLKRVRELRNDIKQRNEEPEITLEEFLDDILTRYASKEETDG